MTMQKRQSLGKIDKVEVVQSTWNYVGNYIGLIFAVPTLGVNAVKTPIRCIACRFTC